MYTFLDRINLLRLRMGCFLRTRQMWKKYKVTGNNIRVHYQRPEGAITSGGGIKIMDLEKRFSCESQAPTILYVVSSTLDCNDDLVIAQAKKRGIRIVLNQNGVSYPACQKNGWRFSNKVLRRVLHLADYIIYQSMFSKTASDKFLGVARTKYQILHNPVDTSFFSPGDKAKNRDTLQLLAAGSHNQFYRVKRAIDTLLLVREKIASARLIIAGRFSWRNDLESARRELDDYLKINGLLKHVKIIGQYTQDEAPDIMRSAHILLHAKYNDNCPRLVVEAISCGVPVVFSASGGVPELIDERCGIGIPAPLDWEHTYMPSAKEMAKAVLTIVGRYDDFSNHARKSAVARFDVKPWLNSHERIFHEVLH